MTDSPGSLRLPVVPGLSGFSVLARGGYATVYRATQDSVAREVAVKVENRTLDSERDQRRFLREARAAGRMSSHPHVVDLFDAGVTVDQHPYLIMELCDGSYADRMRTSPLRAAEAREVGAKIADALADAHQLGVLHRDVKPANILCSRFGEPALADFGLAILAEARDSSVTLEVLTPAYAPPEMFRHSAPSPAVDVYALCATLYALMRGKPPRWADDSSPSLITLVELFSEPIPDLPDCPPALLDVLRAGMANDPGARPTAEQLRDMLAAVAFGGPAPGGGLVSPVSGAGIGSVSGAGVGSVSGAGVGSLAPASPAPVSGGGYPPVSGGGFPPGPGSGLPPVSGGGFAPAAPISPGVYGRPVSPAIPVGHGGPPLRSGTVYPLADSTPTVRTGRQHRLAWILGGIAALVLLIAAGIAALAAANRDPGPSPPAGGPSGFSLPPSGQALPGCFTLQSAQGRCPDKLECFGAVDRAGGVVRAGMLPCEGRHTWEVFAVGELPADVGTADLPDVGSQPSVKRVCNEGTFRAVSLRLEPGWRFEVLPPTPAAFDAGERTYRCLAGKGPGKLTGPVLARRPG